MCTFALEQWAQSQGTFFIQHATLINYLTAATVLVGLVGKVLQSEGMIRPVTPSWLFTIALFGFAGLTVLWSYSPQISREGFVHQSPYIAVYVLLAPLLVSTPANARTALVTLLSIGTLVILLIFTTSEFRGRQIVFTDALYWQGRRREAGNPLAIATLGGYLAIIGVLMNFPRATNFWKYARWGAVVSGVIAVLLSESRGQFFAMVIAIIALLPISRQIRNWRGFLATAIGLLIFAGVTFVAFDALAAGSQRWSRDTMFDVFQSTRVTMASRVLSVWANSSPIHWLLGLGTSSSYDVTILGIYPHVVAVEVLAEEGIIGFLLFGLAIAAAARSILRTANYVRHDPEQRGVLATVASLAFFQFVLSFKQGSMLGSTELFALIAVASRIAAMTEVSQWQTADARRELQGAMGHPAAEAQ